MHSRNGRKATDVTGYMIIKVILAVGVISTAFFLMWWYGLFLPRNHAWKNQSFPYYDAVLTLKHRQLTLQAEDNPKQIYFTTDNDWFVQDVLVDDINRDGIEELVMLLYKHGSFGKHLPLWKKHNDISLGQHLFIYQWDDTRQNRLRALWMSSELEEEIISMHHGKNHGVLLENSRGEGKLWYYKGFGLKYAGLAEETEVSIVCAGDNLISQGLLRDDLLKLYKNVKEEIGSYDLACVNQETPLVKNRGEVRDYPRYASPLFVGDALCEAGFQIVTLANNHILDQGAYGLQTTLHYLQDQKDMICLGVHDVSDESAADFRSGVTFIEKNGIVLALLNATYGTNGMTIKEAPYVVERLSEEERLIKQIEYAKGRSDAVLLFAHFGTEYERSPDEEQTRLCNLFLSYGVDVVIGTHPHVLQPYEMLTKGDRKMLVYYSLGNLLAMQKGADTKQGGLAEFVIRKDASGNVSICDYSLKKTKINASYVIELE